MIARVLAVMALLWGSGAMAAETVAVRAAPHPGYARIVFDWKEKAGYRATLEDRTLTVRFERPLAARLNLVPDRLPDHVAGIRLDADRRTVVVRLKGYYRLRQSAPNGLVILDLLDGAGAQAQAEPAARKAARAEPAAGPPAAKSAAPDPLDSAVSRVLAPPTPLVAPSSSQAPAAAPPQTPATTKAARGAARTPDSAGPFVSVDVVKGRDIASLRFNWREDVSAAVFRRRNQTWVLFDAPARIEIGALRIVGAPVVTAADQLPVVGGTALRLSIDPTRHLRVRRERTIWVVEALPSRPADVKGIEVVGEAGGTANAPDGGRLTLRVAAPGRTLRLMDPDVGDTLYVVTSGDSGLGVPEPRRLIDLEVLESAQGVAVRPISDGLQIEAQARGIAISRPGGLRISREADRAKPRAPTGRTERLYDLIAWSEGPGATLAESRQELVRRAAGAESAEAKRKARLALARFYLGNGFAPEALGVIHEIVRVDARKDDDLALRALRGAARALAGDYALASEDFRHPVLEVHSETAPWRAALAAARGDWKTAAQLFFDLEAVLGNQPSWFASRLGLLAAEASLAVGDTGTAQARLEALAKREFAPAERDALEVLRGHYMKAVGDVDGAVAVWRKVARSNDRKSQARARFALANALYERRDIAVDEAIDRLERLHFAWRGDVYEFDLLRRLAQLYAERGDHRSSLQTLKEAATHFRDIEGVQSIAQEMSATFRRLFGEGDADSLAPITALALFEEFRELTPGGAEGDAMARNLAERLAAVDLLDDAARILEQQATFRLEGRDKAVVATRAAELRLMQGMPQAALAGLGDRDAADVPDALAGQRKLIRARALAALERPAEAIATLAGDDGADAERIRAAIHWRAREWRRAAEAFGRLIEGGKSAEDELAGLVLSRAVALSLAGDDKAVSELRQNHAALMKKSAFAAEFDAVAGGDLSEARNFRSAARVADRIAAFEKLAAGARPAAGAPAQEAVVN